MNILADANVETAIVEWLRSQGHDVLWPIVQSPAPTDPALLRIADVQSRIILTHDLDFGELIFRQRLASTGIILMRFETPLQNERLALLQSFWPAILESSAGHFIVITEHSIRIRPLPPSGV